MQFLAETWQYLRNGPRPELLLDYALVTWNVAGFTQNANALIERPQSLPLTRMTNCKTNWLTA
jgi:hypothetical protein